ncbi:MAG: lysylphosphatidylglycerol synthase domain-containing protein, partial [Longimicrobiales bacterium]
GWAALVGILIFTPDALREPLRPLLTVGLVLLIGISFIFFWAPDPHGLRRFANARGLRPLVRFLEQAHAYSRNRRVLVSSLGLALAQHYLLTTISWILALALGLDISLTVLLWVWPLVMVAVRVPLSILGFGIREFVLFEIASLGGFTGAAGVSLGLLSGALELLFIGFGGILVLQRIGRASSPSQSSRSHLMSHPPTYAP